MLLNNLLIKRARLFTKILKYKISRRRKPIVAYLLITDRCNRRCRYCFVDCSQEKKELTTNKWKDLIAKLHRKGTKMICLMGGEPLVHPDVDEIVDYIKTKEMICEMTSNGILVKVKIKTIKKLDSLMISLDGDKKATDANRGKGAFAKALEAIKIARKNGVTVRLNCVLTKQNKGSLSYLLDLADKYNLYVTYSILADFPEKEKALSKKIMLTDKEIKQTYKKLKKWKQQRRRILFSLPTIDYVINYPLSYRQIIFKGDKWENYYAGQCLFGQVMLYIDSDGSFYPCAALWNSDHYRPQNLLKDGFEKAWQEVGSLKCKCCFCPGVPEWNYITSPAGIWDGLRITLSQIL